MASPVTGSPAPGNAFAAYLSRRRPLVERYLAASMAAPEDPAAASDLDRYLYAPFTRFTASGGKRTRPVLVLLGCEAVGGEARRALCVAAAIEDFQSAALIHDDIADEGQLRRGEPCTYLTEGVGVAVNVGDLGIVRTFGRVLGDDGLPAETRLRVLGLLADMERRTVEGQALDLGWARDGRWDVSSDDYLRMARLKTAHYSAATPLATGAVVGGGSDAQVEALRGFGLDAGLAFQLADDLLNLVGDAEAQGKDFRSDVTEGKRTMAVTWALEHLDARGRDELVGILSAHATDAAALARAVELMEQAGAIDAVRATARRLADSARSRLEGASFAPQALDVLYAMADYFVERAS